MYAFILLFNDGWISYRYTLGQIHTLWRHENIKKWNNDWNDISFRLTLSKC